MADQSGTIDITNTVADMQDSFIKWADDYIYGLIAATPGFGWVLSSVVRIFLGTFIDWMVTKLATSSVMAAFFTNTVIRKASQAVDYINAKKAVNNASADLSEADYEKLEQAEILAFHNFVVVIN